MTELKRLQMMYEKLPPEKKKTNRAHMQKRMDELTDAINGKSSKPASGGGAMGAVQMTLLIVLASVVALGAGFFGVSYLAQ